MSFEDLVEIESQFIINSNGKLSKEKKELLESRDRAERLLKTNENERKRILRVLDEIDKRIVKSWNQNETK